MSGDGKRGDGHRPPATAPIFDSTSHPPAHSSRPSNADVLLLAHLATALDAEGLPALMLIVGESDETWVAGKRAS
jgi:hypothetical protein